jgi:hypothetical protein
VDADRFNGLKLAPVLVRAPPSNVSLPTISGTPELGQTLVAAAGRWQGTVPISYTYRWERCDAEGENCIAIPDATEDWYELTAADVGSTVVLVVTAKNRVGTASATSLPTPVVTEPTARIG